MEDNQFIDPDMAALWAPLKLVVEPGELHDYMFMNLMNASVGAAKVELYLYKHRLTRRYLNVDHDGHLYAWRGEDTYARIAGRAE